MEGSCEGVNETAGLTNVLDEDQPQEQAGLRSGYITLDHLQTIKQIMKKVEGFNLPLYFAFEDYTKKFDSIEHSIGEARQPSPEEKEKFLLSDQESDPKPLNEEEIILKDMLLDLNDRYEQYGMKINANKMKSMVIGRKMQEINLRILNETVERIAMAKEAFNRKRSIACELLEKELRKRLVKCFVWSVALYGAETWTLPRSEEKRIEVFEMWIWRRMEHVKGIGRIRNEAVLERASEEGMMLKLIRKMKRNWLGHWLRRNCLLKNALEGMVNGRRVRGRRRRYQMIDDIKIYESYEKRKRKAENRKDWRKLGLQ
ncbi:hypothetical protein ANN_06745 [Periplaneta americana]|uniref:Reverse transcriptase domain-containing protein n=1 Tax=Periplaneta americana TaxID=6978 RepID=A0ABQ8TG40_PERAM|nr:hypothetical protein ANN_06745 [Periplaneta americana]